MGHLSPPRRAPTLRCQWISPKRQVPLGPSPLNPCQAWSFFCLSAKTIYLFPPGGFVFANFEGCSGSKKPAAYPQFQCSGDHPRQKKQCRWVATSGAAESRARGAQRTTRSLAPQVPGLRDTFWEDCSLPNNSTSFFYDLPRELSCLASWAHRPNRP